MRYEILIILVRIGREANNVENKFNGKLANEFLFINLNRWYVNKLIKLLNQSLSHFQYRRCGSSSIILQFMKDALCLTV